MAKAVPGDGPAGAPNGNRPNKLLVLLLFVTLAFNSYQQQMFNRPYATNSDNELFINPPHRRDEASDIVRSSYERSYAHILPCDERRASKHPGRDCLKKTLEYINSPHGANGTAATSTPWWFHTLLRDVTPTGSGVYGPWHHLTTSDPPVNFCTIDKVATTEWRKVFCQLNADDCKTADCGKRKCAYQTKKKMPEDAPWAVFLRDPLERLLSGFLDKCYKPGIRRKEGHCEPNAVFNPDSDTKDGIRPLLENLEDKDKQMFAAYVDVLPLKWNSHFVPQAIVCDLYLKIGNYDFVGKMGEGFMSELEQMADQFSSQLPRVLNASFGYLERVTSGEKNTGKENNQHSTHAPAKVEQFYTAQTVRRGLELLSIDYVLLGLEVPEWARQMLRDDVVNA